MFNKNFLLRQKRNFLGKYFFEKANMKRERAQSGAEYAKGDGEPSNAFPSEPNSTRTGFISKAL